MIRRIIAIMLGMSMVLGCGVWGSAPSAPLSTVTVTGDITITVGDDGTTQYADAEYTDNGSSINIIYNKEYTNAPEILINGVVRNGADIVINTTEGIDFEYTRPSLIYKEERINGTDNAVTTLTYINEQKTKTITTNEIFASSNGNNGKHFGLVLYPTALGKNEFSISYKSNNVVKKAVISVDSKSLKRSALITNKMYVYFKNHNDSATNTVDLSVGNGKVQRISESSNYNDLFSNVNFETHEQLSNEAINLPPSMYYLYGITQSMNDNTILTAKYNYYDVLLCPGQSETKITFNPVIPTTPEPTTTPTAPQEIKTDSVPLAPIVIFPLLILGVILMVQANKVSVLEQNGKVVLEGKGKYKGDVLVKMTLNGVPTGITLGKNGIKVLENYGEINDAVIEKVLILSGDGKEIVMKNHSKNTEYHRI